MFGGNTAQDQRKEESFKKKMNGLFLFTYKNYTAPHVNIIYENWKNLSEEEKKQLETEALTYESSVIEIKPPAGLEKYANFFCKLCNFSFPVESGQGFLQKIAKFCPKCENTEIYEDYDEEIANFIEGVCNCGSFGSVFMESVEQYHADNYLYNFADNNLERKRYSQLSEESKKLVLQEYQESFDIFEMAIRIQKIRSSFSSAISHFKNHCELQISAIQLKIKDVFYSNFPSKAATDIDEIIFDPLFISSEFCHGVLHVNPFITIEKRVLSFPLNLRDDSLFNFEMIGNHYIVDGGIIQIHTKSFDVSTSNTSIILEYIRRIYFQQLTKIEGKLNSLVLLKEGNEFKFDKKNGIYTLLIFLPSFFEGGRFKLTNEKDEIFENSFASNYDNMHPKFIFLTNFKHFEMETVKSGQLSFLIIDVYSTNETVITSQISNMLIKHTNLQRMKINPFGGSKIKDEEKNGKNIVVLSGLYNNSSIHLKENNLTRNDFDIYSIMKQCSNLHISLVPVGLTFNGEMNQCDVQNKFTKEYYENIIDPYTITPEFTLQDVTVDLMEKTTDIQGLFGPTNGYFVLSTYGIEFKPKQLYQFNSIKIHDITFK